MDFRQIIKRDLVFYRRTNLIMGLLAAVCCAVMTGAMLVGASVQHTLGKMGQMRLGQRTRYAMSTGDRFFRQLLSEGVGGDADASFSGMPVLAVKGILETPDGSVRVNNLNVYGIERSFWELAGSAGKTYSSIPDENAYINKSVEARLGGTNGDFLLRLQKSTVLSQDLIFSTEDGGSRAWAIKITDVVPDEAMGRFSLQASQEPPLNVFVPIEWLTEKIGQPKKANLLLVPDGWAAQEDCNSELKQCAMLSDFGLELKYLESENVFELRTSRIFLDKPIADAAMKTGGGYGVFTYLVNEIRSGEKSVPYSMVSAIDAEAGIPILSDLKADEIIINEWLADELDADDGDAVKLTYFQLTPTRKLIEKTAEFSVRGVVPMMGTFADSTLMPDYPGLTEADSCSDWESGIPIDLDKIRDKDEEYWDKYKGAPKAFVSMEAAGTIWANRFGMLTAVRWPAADNTADTIAADLINNFDLSRIGFEFDDVRKAAQKQASGSSDFAGLFAGLSMFMIFSAAILLGLMFVFYIESRTTQTGLLMAVGWGRWRIFLLFLAEGACIALAGCVLGAVVSVIYTSALIYILNATFWARALAGLQLAFYLSPFAMLKGIAVSVIICVFAIQFALYQRIRRPVHQLLAGITELYSKSGKPRGRLITPLGWGCLVVGVFISIKSGGGQGQVAVFFTAGTLCLAGLVLIAAGCLRWLRFKRRSFVKSLKALAIRSIPRRMGRSLTVLIALACGVFMVIGVGASYKKVGADAQDRHSGTGGFALLGRTTLPVIEPLELDAVSFVPMRRYQQDDASCLNLNKAQQPTLLGVQPEDLAKRDAFAFRQAEKTENDPSKWLLLETAKDENTIPAIGDYATVYWGLGKRLGDTIPYKNENGGEFNLKIVGILKESIVQGRLLISEDNFVRCFPSVDGSQQFFIESDWKQSDEQAKQLMKKYRDFGMEVLSSEQILSQYHEVENTYLAIFLILGGLGLILGSAGLGLVVVLNVIDRKGELAMMQAVGLRKPALIKALFYEHGVLLVAGLLCGAVPALWAVLPSIVTRGGAFPYIQIVLIIVAILISGIIWIRVAVKRILKIDFMDSLKNE